MPFVGRRGRSERTSLGHPCSSTTRRSRFRPLSMIPTVGATTSASPWTLASIIIQNCLNWFSVGESRPGAAQSARVPHASGGHGATRATSGPTFLRADPRT
jgi:hypothetical protein